MLVHPNFDPVALQLGPLAVHWYGLMYLLGFWAGWAFLLKRAPKARVAMSRDAINDLVFYIVMGVILGGRLGYTFFYNFGAFADNPLVLLKIWEGGMSFHGGLIGVIVAYFAFAARYRLNVFDIADFAAPAIPLGLLTGRIGNFINGELWGAPTTLPWGMVFLHAGPEPRHPSMLYEAALEGLVLFLILAWFSSKPRPRLAVSGLFLVLYALFRTAVEFVRLPDAHIGYLYGTDWITMGMMLCVPMWLAGLGMIVFAYSQKGKQP